MSCRRSSSTCPATACVNVRSSIRPRDRGPARVAIFIEVEGAGDYLPPYSGNLDIMTAAATKVGEEIARRILSQSPTATSTSPIGANV